MDRPSDLLRLSDAARYLGVSRRWLYRRIWSGELPASKIGGLYFIRKDDLDALITPPSRAKSVASSVVEQRESAPPVTTEPLKCGYCFRLITTDTQIGDICQATGCDALICTECWEKGVHYCIRHQPDREARWRQAVKDYRQGAYPVLVSSEQARMREIGFLERIRMRMAEITALRHPQGEEVLSVQDWHALEHYDDDRAHLMDLLGVVALDAETLARYPLNARLRYRLPSPKRHLTQKAPSLPPLALEARVLSHLKTMVQDGFDAAPFTAAELQKILLQLASEVELEGEVRLVVLAATTGWYRTAREIIVGTEKELPFVHRNLLIYLYDMEQRQLFYNALDPRLERYAHLLHPALPAERASEAMKEVERLMVRYDSLTLDEALQVTTYDKETLKLAFERLASAGSFALVTLPPDNVWALVRK